MVPSEALHVDSGFVSRLILGALTEHEQHQLAVRLLHADAGFRLQVSSFFEPFEMFDGDLLASYAEALEHQEREPSFDLERARQGLLDQAFARAPNLGSLIRSFTFSDLFRLGEATRRLFSWSMAELLLAKGTAADENVYNVRTNLYLALAVIDVVEILGVVGHSPNFPNVVADVRQRIRATYRRLEEPDAPKAPDVPEAR